MPDIDTGDTRTHAAVNVSMSAAIPPDSQAQFRWYLLGAGAWFAAFGIQMVMFSYLVTTVLHAAPNMIGPAQASLTIVSALLLLVGGALADRIDTRQLLIRCHLFAAVPALALAAFVGLDWLRYEWLIVYGLAMGSITAFVIPARESLLADAIGPAGAPFIQRAVTTTVGVTIIAQIAGMFVARFASAAGATPIILLQVAVQLFGAYTSYRLLPSTRHETHAETNGGSQLQRIAAGLSEVANSYALLPVTIITAAIGILFIGAFMVILPVILREEFGGNVQQFSSMFVAFWSGSMISSMVIARLGNIVHRGRLIVFALTLGTMVLLSLSLKAPLFVFYALVFVWGLGAGVTISMSRTIAQEHAPPALRARVMSIFQLGFTGGMSVGALATGFVVDAIGARAATLVPALLMIFVLAYLLLATKLWSITALKHDASPAA
ncbi:MAG: MFS transporter [Micropepsaceae bacterium]